jgi:zinc-binding in reverse transcriptase
MEMEFQSIWTSHIPLKIKIFLWMVKQNKVLTRDNVLNRDDKELILIFSAMNYNILNIYLCTVQSPNAFGLGLQVIIISHLFVILLMRFGKLMLSSLLKIIIFVKSLDVPYYG